MPDLTVYINPNIGTVGHLLKATAPAVYVPHGIMRISPDFNPGLEDRYFADKIYSFPAGPVSVMAARNTENIASAFDHDLEDARPHQYSVFLETPRVQAAYSVTKHAAIFEFDFFEEAGEILLWMPETGTKIEGNAARAAGKYFDVDAYAAIVFSVKPEAVRVTGGASPGSQKTAGRLLARDGQTLFAFHFNGGKVRVKIGMSFIGHEQARLNLDKEISGFDFEAAAEAGRDAWNKELNKISVQGRETDKRVFYTALYRALARPYNLSEYGRYYSHYDRKVHEDGGREFYCGDGLWDTFRCMHPLQLILEPKVHEDVLASYVRMYEQSGLMPNFPFPSGDQAIMLGFHSASIFADAYVKNIPFDLEKAYEGVRKNAFERSMLPWCIAPSTELDRVYYEKGFFPALDSGQTEWVREVHSFEKRQSVAVTLEHAYSDWCASVLAEALGRKEDARELFKRSRNYKNLFNFKTKFMSPKNAGGEFVEGFDPKLSGGQGGRMYFAENNAWTYTLHVFHDIEGLTELFGGREELAKRLDDMFTESLGTSKYSFLGQFPDATGLSGQFCMGNEPSFHIPYLYNHVGQSHKTQRKIHELIRMWFLDHPLGICGDEDGGAMSAWLVFSAMGFYPTCPGKPVYDLGSPIFDEVTIDSGKAKIKIEAPGASEQCKYIRSMKMNGASFTDAALDHEDLYKNSTLRLEMVRKL